MGKCQVCGKKTIFNFPLCSDCNEKKEKGLIIQCEKCGQWHNKNENCQCKKTEKTKIDIIGENCLDCGDPSYGYLFCKKCYQKYKNKSVILKITNCSEVEILESGYENKITCEDGHPVKSQQEARIDDYLYTHNIKHIYEKTFPIDDNPEHDLHPDFYLPDYDIYIEHFGITGNKNYEKINEYKLKIYKEKGITLIVTKNEDTNNLSANLERKLKYYEKGKINFLDEK